VRRRIAGRQNAARIARRPHFHNDGNFQFKNKFRPENTVSTSAGRRDAPSASFTDVLMIFADPEKPPAKPPGAPSAPAATTPEAPALPLS